jgi:hypothetical protein
MQWYFSLAKNKRAILGCVLLVGVFVVYGLCSAAQQSRAETIAATSTPTPIPTPTPTPIPPTASVAPKPTPTQQSQNAVPVSCFSQQVAPTSAKTPSATPMFRKAS